MEIVVVLILGVTGYFYFKRKSGRRDDRAASVSTPGDDASSKSFALYYIASQLSRSAPGDLPDTVFELLTDRVSRDTEQSLLVNLQMYLSYACGRDRGPDDYAGALTALRTLGQTEMLLAGTTNAVKLWIRKMHKHDTQRDITETELDQQLAQMRHDIDLDQTKELIVKTAVFKSLIDSLFEGRHGRPIREYADSLMRSYEASLQQEVRT